MFTGDAHFERVNLGFEIIPKYKRRNITMKHKTVCIAGLGYVGIFRKNKSVESALISVLKSN